MLMVLRSLEFPVNTIQNDREEKPDIGCASSWHLSDQEHVSKLHRTFRTP